MSKRSVRILIVCWALALSAAADKKESRSGDDRVGTSAWVGTWAAAPQAGDATNGPPEPGFTDSTLRQIVHVSIGGRKIRVRFSNAFGGTPLTIFSAHVAASGGGGKIRTESDTALTFHGQPSVAIPAGALAYSDAIDFDLEPVSDLAVTIRLKGVPEVLTTHPGSRATSYLVAGEAATAADMPGAARVDHWYFLNGLDVLTTGTGAALVTLGDSITDGRGSTTNGNGRWPDDLARRLRTEKKTSNIGVLNEGIGGNRLLHDGAGPNALARLDRDVLAQSGVRWLIVLEGINDIGTQGKASERNEQPATAEEMIAAYEQIIVRAHAHHIRVYGATILPYEGAAYATAEGERDRQTVNRWIRTSGQFDAVIDLEAAVREAKHPTQLAEAADSGDHLHPADAGYRMMSDAIDLKLFMK